MADMLAQAADGIAISLAAKSAETVDVLSDLRGCQVHAIAQPLRGNLVNSLFFQLLKMSVIGGQPLDDRLGYIACHSERSSIPGCQSSGLPLPAAPATFV